MMANRSNVHMQNNCAEGQVSCFGTNQCIPQNKWCDSSVDCLDGSDETACSCKSRLSKDRICDGYLDCPMGSDEIGCFGCDKFSYSCYSNSLEFEEAKKSPFQMCYSAVDKCDGVETCLNGKDEQDCVMISRTMGQHLVRYKKEVFNYKSTDNSIFHSSLIWCRTVKDFCIRILRANGIRFA